MLEQKPEVLLAIAKIIKGSFDEAIKQIKNTRDFDRYILAPLNGFETTESLYRYSSCSPRLMDIKVPTLFIVSMNDPVVP